MSRWIDADAFKSWIDEYVSVFKKSDKAEIKGYISHQPSIEIIRCGECKYWKSTVQMPNGTEVKCLYGRKDDDFCSYGCRDSEKPNNSDTISRQAAISAICNACGKIDCDKMDKCEKLQLPPANCSEFPNNCEHITEDGVTCVKYPACDDCLDNPLNKVKGSERLVKGSEQTEPTISKMEQVDKDINVRSKDEPQTEREGE